MFMEWEIQGHTIGDDERGLETQISLDHKVSSFF